MRLTYIEIKAWIKNESGLSEIQVLSHRGLPELFEKFQDKILPPDFETMPPNRISTIEAAKALQKVIDESTK